MQGASVGLQWTAPGDDGDTGTASAYDLRYSTDGPISDDAAFADATPVDGEPDPSEAGTTESFTVPDLPFDTQVWFAIQTADNFANLSDISNSPSTTTGASPVLSFTPAELSATQQPNQQTDVTLTVANDGPSASTLDFRFPAFAAMELLNQPGIQKNDTSPLGIDTDHPKGEDDLGGVGHPVQLGAGGPDEFGYSWIDSNEPGGPTFDWTDISGVGTEVPLDDDQGATVPLPFNFEFYGEDQTEVTIGSNGYLTFGGEGSALSTPKSQMRASLMV